MMFITEFFGFLLEKDIGFKSSKDIIGGFLRSVSEKQIKVDKENLYKRGKKEIERQMLERLRDKIFIKEDLFTFEELKEGKRVRDYIPRENDDLAMIGYRIKDRKNIMMGMVADVYDDSRLGERLDDERFIGFTSDNNLKEIFDQIYLVDDIVGDEKIDENADWSDKVGIYSIVVENEIDQPRVWEEKVKEYHLGFRYGFVTRVWESLDRETRTMKFLKGFFPLILRDKNYVILIAPIDLSLIKKGRYLTLSIKDYEFLIELKRTKKYKNIIVSKIREKTNLKKDEIKMMNEDTIIYYYLKSKEDQNN